MKKILAIIFIAHFCCILSYLFFPTKVINSYINPIFRQNWHLFAPDPLTFSSRLIVKCTEEVGWLDPTKDLLEKNSRFPLVHYQKSIFLYNSISQTLLDSRTAFKQESQCGKKSLNHCETSFKTWVKKLDAFKKALSVGTGLCPKQELVKLGIYIEHAEAYSSTYSIPNKGIEILELN